MKTKLLLLIIPFALLGLLGGMGTYAWFTSHATSTNSTFNAGTLQIEKTAQGGEIPTPLFATNYDNPRWNQKYATGVWYPGKKVPEDGSQRSLVIHNTGSLPGRIYGASATMEGFVTLEGHPNPNSAKEQFANKMIITIEWEGDLLYQGTLKELLTSTQPLLIPITIGANTNPSETIRLNYSAKMDTSANNDIQGVTATVDLIIHATQDNDEAVEALLNNSQR